jgi:hypothetical protein
MTGTTKNETYSVRALYEVIKLSLLMRDRDLVHFIRTMNDNIIEDFEKIKKNPNTPLNDIIKYYENYTIVFMMIRAIMQEANISFYQEKTREVTNYFLTDELYIKSEKPSKSVYDDED